MISKEYLSFRNLLISFFIILTVMIFAGIYPFNFFPPNRVQWLSNGPGLYFNGAGIAFTKKPLTISLKNGLSVELLLKERRGSRNWGPKEIFSFYDGAASPPILLGQWDGRIFIYSRFENNEGNKWYKLFRTKQRFPRGKSHLVTFTFDESDKAIYIDGKIENKKNVVLNDKSNIKFSGQFLLGNSPQTKNGWRGEIKGLAVYNRILPAEEILSHTKDVLRKGMSGLAQTNSCLALYPISEGKGKTAESIVGDTRPFSIPAGLNALGTYWLSLSHTNMRSAGFHKTDIIKNIIFFVPFGTLLSVIILKKYNTGYLFTFLVVILSGGLLSFVIESLQLFLPSRSPGIKDIFSNVLGSGIGILVTFFLRKSEIITWY